MTLILRKQHAQDHIEGREPPPDWSDDDYAVVDETLVGCIYRQQVQGDIKWLWFLHTVPAPPPNQGIADTWRKRGRHLPRAMSRSNAGNDGGATSKTLSQQGIGRLTFAQGKFQFCSTRHRMGMSGRWYRLAHEE